MEMTIMIIILTVICTVSFLLLTSLVSLLVCKIHHKITLRSFLKPIKKTFVKTKKEWEEIDAS